MADQAKSAAKRSRLGAWAGVLVVLSVLGGVIYYEFSRPLVDPLPDIGAEVALQGTLERAREQLAAKQWEQAETLARQVLQQDPKSSAASLIAGEAATRNGRPMEALQYYQQMSEEPLPPYLTGQWAAGNLLVHLGRFSDAEAKYREVLRRQPNHINANQQLAFLLCIEGRRWESAPYLLELIRQRQFSVQDLLLLGNLDETVEQREMLEMALRAVPTDLIPQLGLARIEMSFGRREEAGKLIKDVLDKHPDLVDAHVIAGELLLQQGDAAAFAAWNDRLPDDAGQHPGIWFIRANWLADHGDPQAATRCLWETIRLHPGQQEANYRLAQLLIAEGKNDQAQPFLQQAGLLDELMRTLHPIHEKGPELQRMVRAARTLEQLHRPWEAWAWYRWALAMNPGETSLRPAFNDLADVLEQGPPRVLPEGNPARQVDLSSYPLPESWSQTGPTIAAASVPAVVGSDFGAPRFQEIAGQVGLQFTYHNGDDPQQPGMELYQELAGGVGVIDFDGDGWPDLYFSQGSDWPPSETQRNYRDKLYRNLGGRRFQDVTEAAGLGDGRFSQGVAIGDVNNDGFPDLVVANIGGNRLYRNEGDGTFTDVTDESGFLDDLWSTSCAIADLNGDTLPDIYVVNYLAGREPFELRCFDNDRPRACTPNNFQGEQDQLWLNRGDGTFQNVTQSAGIVAHDGKGLGVVAMDFDFNGQLDLFVANDTTANFFFVNETPARGDAPLLAERGLLSGLAFDRDGKSQACMGIAVDDIDRDGMFDMFVTNFYNESNAFYRQTSGQFFIDDARAARLRDPGLLMLGFGTQYLDLELDGWADLVVTNGHVDDYRHSGKPFQMPPQAFRNLGNGQFVELESRTLGPFFEGKYLGRSLAWLDWNRDGRQDFSVMHLYDPVVLLENTTEPHGHFLHLKLRGVDDARDAIGSTVQITVGGQTIMKQLAAGDGYQASNERALHFGLGKHDQVEQLTVRWPNGQEQSWQDVDGDQFLMVIQGREQLIRR